MRFSCARASNIPPPCPPCPTITFVLAVRMLIPRETMINGLQPGGTPVTSGPEPRGDRPRHQRPTVHCLGGPAPSSTVRSLGETDRHQRSTAHDGGNSSMPVPDAAGVEFVPSSPELHLETPLVATHEALTAATPPFPGGDVTPGFQPCPLQHVDVCPACLDPALPEGTGPGTACRWPVCGHSYHALCLARSRAHAVRPMQTGLAAGFRHRARSLVRPAWH